MQTANKLFCTADSKMAPSAAVKEPFPISRVANRYLLFDVDIIGHCRRNHNVCGMLIGTIPNLSQQNVFLGIPVELMPEEARVLIETGAAYIVDDEEVHRKKFGEMSRQERLEWLQEMDRRGVEVTRQTEDLKEQKKDKALKEKGISRKGVERDESVAESTATDETAQTDTSSAAGSDLGFIMKGSSFSDSWIHIPTSQVSQSTTETSLFESTPTPLISSGSSKPPSAQKHFVTPTTSYPPLPNPPLTASLPLPVVPDSYPLFRYLHSLGYYHMPGLRFGCHYNAYPGDPLRYHSHFAATGLAWDEEFDLLDVVGGGRLATGTKKAYMVGGEDADVVGKKVVGKGREGEGREVRAFSIEWAGM
jgi:tRNA-splicing endonuclease subunit Sen34